MLTIALLSAALASANAPYVPYAPMLDQSPVAPDTSEEDALRARDLLPIEPSASSEFSAVGPLSSHSWVVRAGYQRVVQLDQLMRHMAPWRVYAENKILVIDINSFDEYQQLIKLGFVVQIDQQRTQEVRTPQRSVPGQNVGITNFPCYRTVAETYASAEALVVQRPAIVEWNDIGDSQLKVLALGGYDIRDLHITNRSIPGPKPALLIQGSIHAREYATVEPLLRFAEQMVQGYGVNPDITWMIDYHDIHLVLIVNPDGRVLAETENTSANPQVRKNRNPNFACATNSLTTGVDLNRNYAFDFGGPGSSNLVCDLVFRGNSAFSEAESMVLSNLENSIFPDQRAETSLNDQTTPVSLDATGIYLDVHSNYAHTLFPWGNSSALAPNATQLQALASKLGFLSGLPAEKGNLSGAIGGATDDWTFGTLGVPGMTVELGGSSFHPSCATFDASIGPPAVASFFMAARTVRAPYRLPSGPDVLGMAAAQTPTGATITASANDTRFNPTTLPTQNIASVALYNTTPWTPGATPIANFTAADGSFNSSVEAITVALSNAQLPSSMNTLYYAQATDAAGNAGPISAVFLSPQILFRDGFE
jgi:carboxypeptidase T